MLILLALLSLPKSPLKEVARFHVVSEPTAIKWSPNGKTLWYVSGTNLQSWPDHRSVWLGEAFPDSTIALRADGNKALVKQNSIAVMLDLVHEQIAWSAGDFVAGWWKGSQFVWITADEKNRQWLNDGHKRMPIEGPEIGAVDIANKVTIAKAESLRFDAPPAIYRFNGRSTGAKVANARVGSEYRSRDAIEWNAHLRKAVVTYSPDTGASLSYFEILPRPPKAVGAIAESVPEWIGNSALVCTRDFYEEQNGAKGYDWYKLKLIDGKTGSTTVLVERRVDFSGADAEDRRGKSPRLGVATGYTPMRLIAYSEWTGKRWEIVICRLTGKG